MDDKSGLSIVHHLSSIYMITLDLRIERGYFDSEQARGAALVATRT